MEAFMELVTKFIFGQLELDREKVTDILLVEVEGRNYLR